MISHDFLKVCANGESDVWSPETADLAALTVEAAAMAGTSWETRRGGF